MRQLFLVFISSACATQIIFKMFIEFAYWQINRQLVINIQGVST